MGFFLENLTAKKMLLFVLLMIDIGSSVMMVTGEVYKVGDSAGWTADSNSNYADWASSKTFHVDDVLLFEYNATKDNVILVTLPDFRSCNTSAPLKMYNSGNDSFTIKSGGHYFFTSNFSGHCQGGQKLDVRVLKPSSPPTTPPPSPTTSPSLSPSPSASHAAAGPVESKGVAPSPTQSKGATYDPKWLLVNTLGVTISSLVVLVHGYA
ncbi:putative Phytocyanin domain, cupredoxin [Helianthus annuus]|uniref:Phytocyanin domain, cupredoxin n=1 Tax=Helianthus annuus TaxID=4232 RepID=A0A251TGG2_HELAN|nr:mavicyanin [Helianthus annuus]KAF5785067.1 putative Phytocyanin domain, cupredoxin [Helianthus annuus]KAJ0512667.1 putative Phytocyanin domain, cupredoxin [Helianthus annuus]KAJ0520269.1 putative Phytocyanin domain, cupredoxin [Helianthus annuus]KAJ0528796.1 putative Phytocyanin domain, cupredoxin [Helianthus annuus]KAJ0695709.1 putative Phytocyanin domain, cupredoxin [Helianthus annuus]